MAGTLHEKGLSLKHILLIGNGHSHLEVLKKLSQKETSTNQYTLISPEPISYYSGLLPRLIMGDILVDSLIIQSAQYAVSKGVKFINDRLVSFNPEDKVVIANPPAAAADLMLSPVADNAVEASILNAGFVVPVNPIDSALAEAEVIVCAPEVNVPPEIANPPVAEATVMSAVPLKDTPPIFLAVWRAVAVPALPEIVVWSPVLVPLLVPE